MPDPISTYLRELRSQLEAATGDLRAATRRADELIDQAESTGQPVDVIERAILEATADDARHRGGRAEAAAAVFRAQHPELRRDG